MEKTCGTCKHFAQHYRKWGKGYHEVNCGHCKYPRLKKRTKGPDLSPLGPKGGVASGGARGRAYMASRIPRRSQMWEFSSSASSM